MALWDPDSHIPGTYSLVPRPHPMGSGNEAKVCMRTLHSVIFTRFVVNTMFTLKEEEHQLRQELRKVHSYRESEVHNHD